MARACEPTLIDPLSSKISPPRFLLEDILPDIEYATYAEVMVGLNLKPLLTRAVHPPHLGFEPVCYIAALATGSFDTKLRDCTDGCWTHRCGPDYVLNPATKENAWKILFKCTISAILSPHVVVQLARLAHTTIEYLLPSPDDSLQSFVNLLHKFKNSKRFLHPIFRDKFGSVLAFTDFLQKFSADGHHMMQNVATKATGGRRKCFGELQDSFLRLTSSKWTGFQIQTIMRTCEFCIHEPFGEVDFVESGHGGKSAAKCLLLAAKTDKFDKTSDIPTWIVKKMEERYRPPPPDRTVGHDRLRQLQLELDLIGLRWSKQFDCLVHQIGIGKKFDSSDAEHAMCMFYTMHQYTLPSRNTSVSPSRIDCTKYFPLKQSLPTKDMPLIDVMANMSLSRATRLKAYKSLLKDTKYDYRCLGDIFRIDHDVTRVFEREVVQDSIKDE
jgi:hypothetical protein